METAILVTITLQPQVKPQAIETYFRGSIEKIRAEDKVSEDVKLSLYRSIEAGQEFIWVTRFPEDELQRVSRANWPFLVLAMLDMLKDIKRRFAANVSVVSSSVLTAEGLLDQWNERYGRFVKVSLET